MSRRPHRVRREPPKVWHNPDVIRPLRRTASAPPPPEDSPPHSQLGADKRKEAPRSSRIVAPQTDTRGEREIEQDRLLDKLRAAEGRVAITKAADELFKGEFTIPDSDQLLQLQLLEHSDEARVRGAIDALCKVLEHEPLKRATVLDSRLRRLEELADDAETRSAASALRKRTRG